MTPPSDPAPRIALLRSRLGIVRRLRSVNDMVAAHVDRVEEAVARGDITRSDAIEELEWLRDVAVPNVEGLARRAGARLPVEGTGVMQH